MIWPVNLLESVPPREISEFKFMVLNNNVHTPNQFSVQLRTTGIGDRFERDTEYILVNRTRREKVISDGRNSSAGVRRQSTYKERTCKITT